MIPPFNFFAVALFLFLNVASHAAEPDLIIADFEGADYGAWKSEGDAFGPGPAQGTLPKQMKVDGFVGHGLANSFHGGDKSTGTLTSPDFKIERKFLTFLIGGGGWEGKTCLNLLVDGKIARTATGPNTKPGGTEALAPQNWEVSEFSGRTARLQIVDNATGGWGHINVDQIVLTDRKPAGALAAARRDLMLDAKFLQFPVKTGAPKRKVQLLVDGKLERFFDIELADGQPDWWSSLDVSAWKGRRATVSVDQLPEDSQALAMVEQGGELRDASTLYHEALRPLLHFSPQRGWNNDPNGLAFFNGEYHLFFQHNPYGWSWGNMHWGHAVSPDLLHWRELGEALYPDQLGPMFSGSAVVDVKNTSGFGEPGKPPLVLIYTAAGNPSVQCLAYSTDGRTFAKYAGNPVVKNISPGNRDPRVFWHEPSQHWVMALYVAKAKRHTIHFFTSPNLREWTLASVFEGGEDKEHFLYECPDIFELSLDGDASRKKWVLTAANSEYAVGTFDGSKFTAEESNLHGVIGSAFYAAQTYNDEPHHRRIQFGWLRAPSPGMPFNQGMTIPLELTLRSTPSGPRLHWLPAKELDQLREKTQVLNEQDLKPNDNPIAPMNAELLDLRADLQPGDATQISFDIHGTEIIYDPKKQELIRSGHHFPLPLINGRLHLRILTDRTALEIFGADGLLYLPTAVVTKSDQHTLGISAQGGTAHIHSLEVSALHSIWPDQTTKR